MNGYTLKLIAMITMFIDHMAAILLPSDSASYLICRYIGRLAFPIFCFLLVEGFEHTHNVKRYMARLGIFALLSEIPFDLAFSDKSLKYGFLLHQNVFFTLFIGLVVIWVMRIIRIKLSQNTNVIRFLSSLLQGVVVMIGCFTAYFLYTDYDYKGVFLIVAFYVFRKRKVILTLAVLLINQIFGMVIQLFATASMVLIWWYNGKRGPQGNKYFFYFFYPAHILFLYLISLLPVFH